MWSLLRITNTLAKPTRRKRIPPGQRMACYCSNKSPVAIPVRLSGNPIFPVLWGQGEKGREQRNFFFYFVEAFQIRQSSVTNLYQDMALSVDYIDGYICTLCLGPFHRFKTGDDHNDGDRQGEDGVAVEQHAGHFLLVELVQLANLAQLNGGR